MIDRLRELLRADGVTAGPWWADSPGFGTIFVDAPTHDERVWLFDVREGTAADAALIVEAVNALPELLSMAAALSGLEAAASKVARITVAGDAIPPSDDHWHDLDEALEAARAALEPAR